jgi:hypothetical protein
LEMGFVGAFFLTFLVCLNIGLLFPGLLAVDGNCRNTREMEARARIACAQKTSVRFPEKEGGSIGMGKKAVKRGESWGRGFGARGRRRPEHQPKAGSEVELWPFFTCNGMFGAMGSGLRVWRLGIGIEEKRNDGSVAIERSVVEFGAVSG